MEGIRVQTALTAYAAHIKRPSGYLRPFQAGDTEDFGWLLGKLPDFSKYEPKAPPDEPSSPPPIVPNVVFDRSATGLGPLGLASSGTTISANPALASQPAAMLAPVGSTRLAPTGPVPAIGPTPYFPHGGPSHAPPPRAPAKAAQREKSGAVIRHNTNTDPRQIRSELAIIRALYRFITGEMTGQKHPEFESQDQLFELFIDEMPYYYGISDSTLTNKVNEAKALLAQAEELTPTRGNAERAPRKARRSNR